MTNRFTSRRAPQARSSDVAIGLVANLLGIGTVALSVTLALIAEFSDWSMSQKQVIAAAVGAGALGCAGGLAVAYVLVKRLPPKGYRIISINQTYELLEENTRIQRQVAKVVIQATRPGVYLFIDRTHWSGSKPPRLSAPRAGQTLWEVPYSMEGWHAYVIALQQPLAKGETAEVVLQAEYHSLGSDDDQWVAKTPTEPIQESLTLRIVMGRNLPQPGDIWAGVLAPGTGDRELKKRLPVEHDALSGTATVVINAPRLGDRHHLRVRFSHTTPADALNGVDVGRAWGAV